MSNRYTASELEQFLEDLKSQPDDVDLLNRIAIAYFNNPAMCLEHEDLKFFERAYSTRRTIKSAHNLAWYLFNDWNSEDPRILELLKEAIEKKPRSYYPYLFLGDVLIERQEFKGAIPHLEIAYKKSKLPYILSLLSYCYSEIGELNVALDYIQKVNIEAEFDIQDSFTEAVLHLQLGNNDRAKAIADKLALTVQPHCFESVDGFEIGDIYFYLGDIESAAEVAITQGIEHIDPLEWLGISYSLYITHRPMWESWLKGQLALYQTHYSEILQEHPDWKIESEQDKQELLKEKEQKIEALKAQLSDGITLPKASPGQINYGPSGCLLFDCRQHDNLVDD